MYQQSQMDKDRTWYRGSEKLEKASEMDGRPSDDLDKHAELLEDQKYVSNTSLSVTPSFASSMLEHQKQCQLKDKELGYLAGAMFGASSDMAMPTFDDQEMLPQVTAFMLESLRLSTSHNEGHHLAELPHSSRAIPNDPEVFPEPHKFNPQCWINNAGHVHSDLQFFTYSFGHQVCPGQHVANQLVFITMALTLVKIDKLAFSDTAIIHAALFEICFEKRMDENMIGEVCTSGKEEAFIPET
ncbi:hypothetical protein BDR06DRAFT_974851 [Suillus hirtellus]|nr:hypothetical protein BDR06DRAFT_974851 [Suillus hirtellus]